LAGIKKDLNRLIEVRSEGSVISTQDVKAINKDNEQTWSHIQKELEETGIAREVIDRNRRYFVAWIASAIENNEKADANLDGLGENPLEGDSKPYPLCGKKEHNSQRGHHMNLFDTKNGPSSSSVPEDKGSPPPIYATFDTRHQHPCLIRPSRRKTRWVSAFGMSASLTEGFAVGFGLRLPEPFQMSSSSTGSSYPHPRAINSGYITPTLEPRRGLNLMSRMSSKVLDLGSPSPRVQPEFSRMLPKP
jgi:hypothetical protein